MDVVRLDPESTTTPFEQVRAQIAGAIESGALPPATRLPTVRELAADLGLAVNTVARAYRHLELEGAVTTHGRHGTYVAGEASVARQQAAMEAREFVERMRRLGVGEAEMVALLRRARRDADQSDGGPPAPP